MKGTAPLLMTKYTHLKYLYLHFHFFFVHSKTRLDSHTCQLVSPCFLELHIFVLHSLNDKLLTLFSNK